MMWQVYTSSWRIWWLPALLQALLGAALDAWLQHIMPPLPSDLTPAFAMSQLSAFSAFAASGAVWYPVLATVLASMLPFTAMVVGFERLVDGQPLGSVQVLRRALPLWPGAMLALLCYVAAVCLGSLLLLVPGVWLGGRWLLWPVALVRQGGGVESLERGAALLRGRWLRVNGWITLVFLLVLVASLVIDQLVGWLPAPLPAIAASLLLAPAMPLAMVLAARGREFR
jgi:hypothetical protein